MHTRSFLSWVLAALLIAFIAGCGGSTSPDSDDGSDANPDPGTNPDDSSTIDAGVNLVVDSNNLPSNATTDADGVQISAIVRDANNNVVQDQTVTFSADSGAVQVTRPTTDESGTAAAVLTTGGNPQNRAITVTANTGANSDTVQVQVVGTQLSVAGPAALALGDSGTYTASLSDAGGGGIADQPVTVSSANGNTLSMSNPQTDSNGQAQFMLTASNAGTDTLTAEALGLSAQTQVEIAGDDFQLVAPDAGTQVDLNTLATVTLRWLENGTPVVGEAISFSTTRGALDTTTVDTDTNGEASVTVMADNAGPATVTASAAGGLQTSTTLQFIATEPDSIDVQADPATLVPNGQSDITAIVRDPNNNLVTGETVNFTLNDTGGGSLRDGSATTNINGVASTVYTAGSNSAAQPASITATVGSDTSISGSVEVTIGGQALRITLGTGNELAEPNTTTYQLPYVAVVTDANGVPAPDANFRLSVVSRDYQKGESVLVDNDGNGTADGFAPRYSVGSSEEEFGDGCRNEDTNGNGVLDMGEDINGNGRLEPGNVATVPSTVALDDNGTAEFNVTYPQNFAQWVRIRLRAVASVQGTETTSDAVFILPVLADDVNDPDDAPPNPVSPFGTADNCANPD